MGCIISRKTFIVHPDIEGQDESAMEIFKVLGLSQYDVDLLYTAFWDIDADSSGLIRPLELFNYFEMEETTFTFQLFSLFDEDHSGMINFMEFVCTLWNFLTTPEINLGALAYLMKDPTAKANISFIHVQEIIEMMHMKKINKDPNLQSVFQQMRKDLEKKLTIDDFNRWAAANPSVIAPLKMLQLHIRLQIIGESFWYEQEQRRKKDPTQSALTYVKDLQTSIISKNKAFRDRLAEEERERRRLSRIGKGRHGDTRGNIARKESVLLQHFNLKRLSLYNSAPKRSLSRVIPQHEIADFDDEQCDDEDEKAADELMNAQAKAKRAQQIAAEKKSKALQANNADREHESNNNNNNSTAANPPVRRRRSLIKPNLNVENKKKTKSKKSRQKDYGTSHEVFNSDI